MLRSAEVVKSAGEGSSGAGGGHGRATAYSKPHSQLSSPAGITATTAADAIFVSGNTSSITVGQEISFASQGNWFATVKGGISLFTYGKATKPDKPNQEIGIKLHAASGMVSVQAQSDVVKVTADGAITVASVTKSVNIAAKEHVMLTAQGAYLKLECGNIMIHGLGTMEFKASMKQLGGPQRSNLIGIDLHAPGDIRITPQVEKLSARVLIDRPLQEVIAGTAGAAVPYQFLDHTGRLLANGVLDDKGATQRLYHDSVGELTVLFAKKGDWTLLDHAHGDDCGCGGHGDAGDDGDTGEDGDVAVATAALTADDADASTAFPADDDLLSQLREQLLFSRTEVL